MSSQVYFEILPNISPATRSFCLSLTCSICQSSCSLSKIDTNIYVRSTPLLMGERIASRGRNGGAQATTLQTRLMRATKQGKGEGTVLVLLVGVETPTYNNVIPNLFRDLTKYKSCHQVILFVTHMFYLSIKL